MKNDNYSSDHQPSFLSPTGPKLILLTPTCHVSSYIFANDTKLSSMDDHNLLQSDLHALETWRIEMTRAKLFYWHQIFTQYEDLLQCWWYSLCHVASQKDLGVQVSTDLLGMKHIIIPFFPE